MEVPHRPRPGDGELNLTDALQYGPAIGFKRTQEFIRELTERIYSPAYDGWTHVLDTGTTDGCGLFCACARFPRPRLC